MRTLQVVVVVALAISACYSNVKSSRYATLRDARADELFGRGWLPDILPPSSHDIRVNNNLDANISYGEFHFDPGEFKLLEETLSPYTKTDAPLASLAGEVEDLVDDGYPAYEFVDGPSTWVFLCRADRGACEYRMWLRRS